MPVRRKIQAGDCISSLSKEHGLFPQTLWDEPQNRELREARESGHILNSKLTKS